MRTAAEGARRLREALRQQGGELAALSDGGVKGGTAAGRRGRTRPARRERPSRAPGASADYELLLETILEGSCCTTAPPRSCAPTTRTWRCCSAISSTRSGSRGWLALGDLEAVAELADVISLLRPGARRADRRLAEAVWAAGARRSAGASAPSTSRPRTWPAQAIPAPPKPCGARPSSGAAS